MGAGTSESQGQYLTFILRDQLYGVPVGNVREINRISDITKIPQTPKFVAGVINLRGKIISVINLREKLAFESVPPTKETCIVVIETAQGQIGVIVDAVRSVVDLPLEKIEKTPDLGEDTVEAFVIGIGKLEDQVVILVDIAKTLSREHLKEVVNIAVTHVAA